MKDKKRIYLDYAATTPIHPEVLSVMQETAEKVFGNPSSLHNYGREAKQAIDQARVLIADGLGSTNPTEIIFTGGGSEADNLAIIGIALAYQDKGKHIITSCIEHHAVLHACEYLESIGFEVTYLEVDQYGLIQPDTLDNALRPDTTLVSIMHANNEIGTVQPIDVLAEIAHSREVNFHTDAVQTVGQLPLDINDLKVDLLSISAHKFYGPKGVGALFIREDLKLIPILHGGNQEDGRRAGTENLPGIIGTGKAFQLAVENLTTEPERIQQLNDQLWRRISNAISDARLNGHPEQRLPNNLNVCFKDIEAEGLLFHLNLKGIAASMGSACDSESIDPSHVIRAIKVPVEWERGALRLSLGRNTTPADCEYAAAAIIEIVNKMRS
jgi:cysteine desulfurase